LIYTHSWSDWNGLRPFKSSREWFNPVFTIPFPVSLGAHLWCTCVRIFLYLSFYTRDLGTIFILKLEIEVEIDRWTHGRHVRFSREHYTRLHIAICIRRPDDTRSRLNSRSSVVVGKTETVAVVVDTPS